jgi:3-methyladenine DNA glycosylase Mpg
VVEAIKAVVEAVKARAVERGQEQQVAKLELANQRRDPRVAIGPALLAKFLGADEPMHRQRAEAGKVKRVTATLSNAVTYLNGA